MTTGSSSSGIASSCPPEGRRSSSERSSTPTSPRERSTPSQHAFRARLSSLEPTCLPAGLPPLAKVCNTSSQTSKKSRALFLAAKARLHCDWAAGTSTPHAASFSWPPRPGSIATRSLWGSGARAGCFSWPPRPGSIATAIGAALLLVVEHFSWPPRPGSIATSTRSPTATPRTSFPGRQGQAPLRRLDTLAGGRGRTAFPGRQGQAPLRLPYTGVTPVSPRLFLAAKARLHCDRGVTGVMADPTRLFLAAKARLHCDMFPGL